MKLKTLKLVNFRNYDKAEFTFNDELNIIYGNNGSGKTNLVESIYALSLTKSFRTNNDKNLIKKDELSTKITGIVEKNTKNSYQVVISKEGKKVKIDNNLKSKISDYITNINTILLEPEEQIIFNDSPGARRKLINIEISQLKKEYLLYLNDYNKIVKQRNFYIKELYINGNSSRDYFDILTNNLIEKGKKIYELRKDFIDKINLYINKCYHDIFESGELKIKYVSDFNNKSSEEIFNYYKKNYDREINYGKTLFGIHHDDVIFMLDNEKISEWGSNGQKKNAILAFKLAEIEVFYKETGEYPILILDDIFSALDNKKIENILKNINRNVQTFITTTDIEKVNKEIIKDALLIKVNSGKIEEA